VYYIKMQECNDWSR